MGSRKAPAAKHAATPPRLVWLSERQISQLKDVNWFERVRVNDMPLNYPYFT